MKVAIYTLGCKMNQYETQAMEQLLRQKGHQVVDFAQKADVYVVNTCSVTAVRLLSATGSRVRLPRGTPLERSRWGSKSLHQPFPAISSRAKYIYDYSEERFFCQVQRRFFTGQRQEKERGLSWMLRPLPYGINE